MQCRSAGELRKPTDKLTLNKDGAALNKIVFLTYKVRYDSLQQQHSFQLINKIFADGELNPNTLAEQSYIEPDYLYCEVTGTPATQYNKVEDPLLLIREYPADEHSGQLTKVEIRQPEGEITLRFQYMPGVKNILIKIPYPHSQKLKTIYYAQL
jgi:hypothetical protein